MTAMELPLLQHELARMGRRRPMYFLRMMAASVVALGFAADYAVRVLFPSDMLRIFMSESYAFAAVSSVQYLLVFVIIPAIAAGAIAQEKQYRTLELLALADLRGFDIYIAKSASALIYTAQIVLAMLPVLAIILSIEGMALDKLLQFEIQIIAYAIIATTIGIMWSAFMARPAEALILTYVSLACYGFCTGIAKDLLDGWISYSFLAVGLGNVVLPGVVAAVVAFATIRHLPKLTTGRAAKRRRTRKRARGKRRERGVAEVYGGVANVYGTPWLRGRRRFLVMVLAVLLFGLVGFSLPTLWIVLGVVAYDTVSIQVAARRDGALDELATTSASNAELNRSVFRVHYARSLTFFPALVVSSALQVYFGFMISTFSGSGSLDAWMVVYSIVFPILKSLVALAFAVAAGSLAASKTVSVARGVGNVVAGYIVLAILSTILMSFIGSSFMIGTATSGDPKAADNMANFMMWSFAIGAPSLTVLLLALVAMNDRWRMRRAIGEIWRNESRWDRPIPAEAGA